MTESIRICEVGPRDGLQNERHPLTTEQKALFLNGLREAGLNYLEAGSFVHPKAVPTMADTDLLLQQVKTDQEYLTTGLIMNERGFDRALQAGVDGVCIVTVVSETLCQKNNRRSTQEALETAINLIKLAKENNLFIRVDVAPAWVCPMEGQTKPEQVFRVTDQIWEYGVDELTLCDTVGYAQPRQVRSLFEQIADRYDIKRIGAHFHDTQAMALANCSAALEVGVRLFDSSAGGLGGCPFAPGARGNLATEDLVLLAEKSGFSTGVNLSKLWNVIDNMSQTLERPIGGQTKDWWSSRGRHMHNPFGAPEPISNENCS